VREGYAARCAAAPQRFVRLDAQRDRETVWAQIVEALRARAG
jgi:dTMP kinase